MSNWSLLTLLKIAVLSGTILLISGSMTARADWRVQSGTDAITDREEKIAEVRNQRGYRFGVYRVERGEVFAIFELPSNLVGSIDHDRPMHLRIDKNEPHEENGAYNELRERLTGEKIFYWEPGFVNFVIWHGKQDKGIARVIDELMAGDQLLIRYPVGTGGTRDVSFSLSGSKPAITEALELTDDPAVKARAMAAKKANKGLGDKAFKRGNIIIEYNEGCLKESGSERSACTGKYLDCAKSYPGPDWQGLQSCLMR